MSDSLPPPYPPASPTGSPVTSDVPLAYQLPVAPVKPVSVMVIGVIGIVFGSLGVLCSPVSLLPMFVKSAAANNPALQVMQDNPLVFGWTLISAVINTLLAALLLAGSIGSVTLKRWARKSMILYAIAEIVMVVLGMVVTLAFVLPATFKTAQATTSIASNPGATWAAVGGGIGAVIGLIFALALPVCILVFFRKRNVIAAFDRGAGLPSNPYTPA